MNKIKKIICLFLAISMALGLSACGNESGTGEVVLPTGVPAASELVSSALVDPDTDWWKYDELISKIYSETNLELRAQYIKEAEDMLMAGFWIIPISIPTVTYLKGVDVENLVASPVGLCDISHIRMSGEDQVLSFGGYIDPGSLDPTLSSMLRVLIPASLCFRGLLQYDQKGNIQYDLAEKIEVSEDGITYTVTLKEGLLWSDGVPITANDFAYSWQRTIEPQTASPYEYLFSVMSGYEEGKLDINVIDDRTFEFSLCNPCPYINDLLSFAPFFPVRRDVVESYEYHETIPGGWAQSPGFPCSGPYTVKEWQHNNYIVYEKNENYWNAAESDMQRVEQMISADKVALYSSYCSGDLDLIFTVPSSVIGKLTDENSPELGAIKMPGFSFLAFPQNSDFLADKTVEEATCVRKALALLIDRNFICKVINKDGSEPLSSVIPAGFTDGNGGVLHESTDDYFNPTGITDDREGTLYEARTLLMAAGYKFEEDGKLSSETPLSITMTNYSSSELFECIQQDFAILGIKATISTQDRSLRYSLQGEGKTQVQYSDWYADFNDPISILEIFTVNSFNNSATLGHPLKR